MEEDFTFEAWLLILAEMLNNESIVAKTVDLEAFTSLDTEVYEEMMKMISRNTWF